MLYPCNKWDYLHYYKINTDIFYMTLKEGSDLDLVSLDVQGGHVGQVVSRGVVVDGASPWLSLGGQNQRGARRGWPRRGGGRCRLLSQHQERNIVRKILNIWLKSKCEWFCVCYKLTWTIFTFMGWNSFAFGFNVEIFICLQKGNRSLQIYGKNTERIKYDSGSPALYLHVWTSVRSKNAVQIFIILMLHSHDMVLRWRFVLWR